MSSDLYQLRRRDVTLLRIVITAYFLSYQRFPRNCKRNIIKGRFIIVYSSLVFVPRMFVHLQQNSLRDVLVHETGTECGATNCKTTSQRLRGVYRHLL